ncbi:MAG: DNA-formamidopyrimidine glycosylase [Actinomycetota bacterium]|nr:DNA-formamidopyrimidine glycosylase [Actinomycetota bacterium]
MPELPEVESVRRQLHPRLVGRRVLAVDAVVRGRVHDVARAVGHRVLDVRRRGKYLIAPLDGGLELVGHLGMTGSFRLRGEEGWAPDAYVRASLHLDDGVLDFRDVRRFGMLRVTPAGDYSAMATLARLGPEPLSAEFDPVGFHRRLAATRMPVKPYLLTQRPVAGVGNIYADEALWQSGVSPRARRVGRLRAHALWAAVRQILAEAIEREGTTFRDYRMVDGQGGRNAGHLRVYGRAGLPCARCGRPLAKTVVGGRGTTYCRGCQRR